MTDKPVRRWSFAYDPPYKGDYGHLAVFYTVGDFIYVIPQVDHYAIVKELEAQLAAIRAEVQEWVCDKCNFCYPGPPQAGFKCVICPRCSGTTLPAQTHDRRRAEAERDAARARLERAKEHMRHPHECEASLYGTDCTCGLDAFLWEIEK